ncbi:hypothetical protein K2173_025567 [Erythroxylum novogranatense]|uniref:TATA-box-binding protein n=1 Tax=Erythroxylum novogranatense TaxID=1862640 RepID=A0AAV8T8R0_9ROSI|nr:hypothetical protein K2173_025567 [Erythroxylum novogranatense]
MAEQSGSEGSQPVDLSKHPSGIVPTLQNIVSTVNLDCKLDLKQIALQARNAEYNPKRFAAVIMRIREPKTTALIFASGKMVCTGAKSEQQSKLAARKYARIIQKLGFPAKFKDFKIQNIVGSCDVKFPIRLEGLAYSHGAFSSYEPELFPGLIYRMKQPKIVLLIFVSGKIVITGAKVRDETYTAFENIYPVLTEFRKVQQCGGTGQYRQVNYVLKKLSLSIVIVSCRLQLPDDCECLCEDQQGKEAALKGCGEGDREARKKLPTVSLKGVSQICIRNTMFNKERIKQIEEIIRKGKHM